MHEADRIETPGEPGERGDGRKIHEELVPAGELGAVMGGDDKAADRDGERPRVDAYQLDGDRTVQRGGGVLDQLRLEDDRGEEEAGE